MRKTGIIVGAVIGVVAIILIVILVQNGDEPDELCLDIGYLDITASAPFFIAQELNLYEKYDLCVESQQFATSNQLVDAIATGRIDYVVETSAVPALALQARWPGRFYITATSTISQEEPFDAILVLQDSEIETLKDLEGTKISVFPGTTAKALLKVFLEEQGVNTSNIEFSPTPPANLIASVKSGAVDAAHVYEPAWTIGRNDSTLRELFGNVYGRQLAPNPQGISMLSRQAASDYPEESKELVRAFDEALNYMRTHENSARVMIGKHFELLGNTVHEMHLLYMAPHNSIDWNSLEAYVNLLLSVGELDTRPELESLKYN